MRVIPALLAAVMLLAPAALASDVLTDARGDATPGPDIVAVKLSHSDERLAIAVEFASAPPLGYDEEEQYTDMLLIGIHTDDDLGQDDVEFWTGVHGVDLTRGMVVRSDPRGQVGTADVTVDEATVTLQLERALLDDPDEVAVSVAAARESVDEGAGEGGEPDFAPDEGAYAYSLSDGGGPGWLWPLVGAVGGAALVALGIAALRRALRRHRAARPPDGPVPSLQSAEWPREAEPSSSRTTDGRGTTTTCSRRSRRASS